MFVILVQYKMNGTLDVLRYAVVFSSTHFICLIDSLPIPSSHQTNAASNNPELSRIAQLPPDVCPQNM